MKTKLLIVDDSRIFRNAIEESLASENDIEVVGSVWNGVKAIEFIQSNPPDLVTLDVEMPDMDGLEALKQIQKIDSNAKVAMVTAMGQQSIVMEAIKAGAKDFVVKPFDPNRVLAAIQKMIG